MHQKLTAAAATLLLISAVLGCSMLRPKRNLNWRLELEVDPSASDQESAVRQTVAIIKRRLDAYPVSNFEVQVKDGSTGRIQVSLPHLPNPERVKEIITAGGRLELVAVISPPSPSPVQTYDTKEEAAASWKGRDPATVRILPYAQRDEPTTTAQRDLTGSQSPTKWVLATSPAIVDGSELRSASAVESNGDYQILFSLTAAGAEKFGAWTAANINNYLGVVLNNEVKSIAYIRGQINDSGEITGRFTKQSAEDLALVLQSGALPAPVRIVSETFDAR